jgi:branched-subunit amino acid ABC-type transport system permease component
VTAVLISGLFVGLIYGLLGVGLVVVYRGSRVINFAYGASGMAGAMAYAELRAGVGPRFGSFGAAPSEDLGLWPALPIGILIAAALAALTELMVVRPLRLAPRLTAMVGTFAVGSLILTFAARRWSLDVHSVPPLVAGDGIQVGSLLINPSQLLILFVCPVLLVGLWALYRFSPFGIRLRALAQDPYAAGLVGVNVNLTSALTWAMAGALAGLSTILIAPLVGFNVAYMTTLLVRGLAAALIARLTSVNVALGAGIVLGLAEAVFSYKASTPSLIDVVVVMVVLPLLLLRRRGAAEMAY